MRRRVYTVHIEGQCTNSESLTSVERSPAGRAACLIMLRCDIEIAKSVRIVALSRDMHFELVTRNRQYRAPVAGELQTGALTALEEPVRTSASITTTA